MLDANVLLNLYRSNERTRRDTLSVLGRLQERLWIPHQVLTEFWRNRSLPSVRGHHRTKAQEASASLDKSSRSIKDALDRWLKDVHLNSDEEVRRRIESAKSSLNGVLEGVKSLIREQAEMDAVEGTATTHTDPILKDLEGLLRGRIGDPLSSEEFNEAVQEAQRRADREIPPGYADFRSKEAERAAGDYILWVQLLREAAERCQNVLLVTGDIKEDWWVRRDGDIPARPRKELELELRQQAGVDLYMLTPSQLLAEANEILGLKVDQRSVSDLATSENASSSTFPRSFVHEFPNLFRRAHRRVRSEITALTSSGSDSLYPAALASVLLDELGQDALNRGGTVLPLLGQDYPVVDGSVVIPLRCGGDELAMRHAHVRVGSSAKVARAIKYLEACTDVRKGELPPNSEVSVWIQTRVNGIVVVPFASSLREGVREIQWGILERGHRGHMTWVPRGRAKFAHPLRLGQRP
ncbi:PIN-like domain-containing protein [Streptomyces sp. NPDC014864]|uniref:PIN-like domain-containing protein n=1 Tax=Streptomyces sp. NPDC014864 TaxID=3364924 RepID=UPI0037030FCE